MLRALYSASPFLSATTIAAVLVVSARAFTAETLETSDLLFRAHNVIRVVSRRGEVVRHSRVSRSLESQ
jgi:hypothetical protein